MNPRILAVGTANPPLRFAQEEAFRLAGYSSRGRAPEVVRERSAVCLQLVPFHLNGAMYSTSELHIIAALWGLRELVGLSRNGTVSEPKLEIGPRNSKANGGDWAPGACQSSAPMSKPTCSRVESQE